MLGVLFSSSLFAFVTNCRSWNVVDIIMYVLMIIVIMINRFLVLISAPFFICLFKITPINDFSIEKVAIRVAAESSNGTWTTLQIPEHIRALSAKVFDISGSYVKIAYPNDLFEEGNMPQVLSSIAGNIFGMKALKGLRLVDVKWPQNIIQSFKGPQFGVKGIRNLLKIDKRPLDSLRRITVSGISRNNRCCRPYKLPS